jgi:glycosyltransferase involved in cell wall biosynthesis
MKSNNARVTIVFVSGRKKRLSSKEPMSKEFFYSYHYLKEIVENIEIVEFNSDKNSKLTKSILNTLDKTLRKMTRLPIFMHEIINKETLIKFKNSSHLIFSNDRIACSLIPVLIYYKICKRKINTTFFALGVFNENSNNKIVLFSKKLFLKSLISVVDNIVFLGEGEYKTTKEKYKKYESKFNFIPFCVDNEFWSSEEINMSQKEGILFIGNDGKRDFDKAIKISKALPDYKFTFVSSRINQDDVLNDNVTLIKGHWNYSLMTDSELKNLYQKSKITIIPLIESLQPSGQSVALQSMSVGTPVVISKTEGFWDFSKFINMKNIILMENNDLDSWIKTIDTLYKNEVTLLNIAKTANDNVKKEFDISIFNKNLSNLIGITSE